MPRKYTRRSKGSPLALEKKTITNIIGFSMLAVSILLLISLFTKTGALLQLKTYATKLFGIGTILIPFLIAIIALPLVGFKKSFTKANVAIGIAGVILSFIGLVSAFSEKAAGVVGASLWATAKSTLTSPGAFFVLLFAFIISAIITMNTSVEQTMGSVSAIFKKISSVFGALGGKFKSEKPKFSTKIPLDNNSYKSRSSKLKGEEAVDANGLGQSVIVNSPGQTQIWQYPPLSLLNEPKGSGANRGNVKQNAQTIEKTLEAFGIHAEVVEVNPGPTVTQYALKIPVGTKLSKILTLQNDLALNLATSTGNVRIEAPIPGKSLIGIEIPNISPEIVTLKNVLSSDVMRTNKSKTAVGMGFDVSGNTIIADIAKMPHLLIAGTTGSGKSVLMNALIATLLFRASPQEVKLILVDPKRVELNEYNDIPHLLTPVIVEPDKILSALKWAMQEMDRRYKLFKEAQVRNIAGYNELSGFQALPYIIIIIDELHSLMEFAPVEVEDAIVRLAALARATGIHLVVATQRPSVDVITGLIKANIPARIAFNVSSMVDSRVIIDSPGAEKLLGKGDMLYVPPDASKPQRIQGVYVSDNEIRNLIDFLKNSGFSPEYTEEVTQMPIGKAGGHPGGGGDNGDKDDLFDEAVRTVCQYDRASASLLQRRLRVGYARAARLIDELETAGIIGPGEGSKPRDVLVKNAEEYLQSGNQSPE
ncbi:MAG TPA: DNA translocase FtsK [Candidatus Saccharimonadales bacterium]|nr:DNA translocase FtsK [Candidatus Saccharimonadales bacterium]